jgi:hypothetical protein
MSHERGSVPTPEGKGGRTTPISLLMRLLGRLRRHVATWPERYVEMRVGERP